jgi:hypothetical protein
MERVKPKQEEPQARRIDPETYAHVGQWIVEDYYADRRQVGVPAIRRAFDKLGLRYRKVGPDRFYLPSEVDEAMDTGQAPEPKLRRRRLPRAGDPA